MAVGANFATSTLRASRGTDLRDGLNRDARFVGLAVSRDLQEAGVAFESTQPFVSVATRGDTVLVISVPFLPNQAEVYNMVVPIDTTDPLPAGGTCGPTCIDVVDPNTVPFQIYVADVALLQVQTERRLIVVTARTSGGVGIRHLTFSNADTLFAYPAGSTQAHWCRSAAIVRQLLAPQPHQQHPGSFRRLQSRWYTAGTDHGAWR